MAETLIYGKIAEEDINQGHGTFSATLPDGSTASINKVGIHTLLGDAYLSAADFSGADLAAKVMAAITALPSDGGIVDARSLPGSQAMGSDMFSGNSKPVIVLLPGGTITVTATQKPNDDTSIFGCGRLETKLVSSGITMFESADKTIRKYRITISDMWLYGTNRATANGIALDLSNVSAFHASQLRLSDFETIYKFYAGSGLQSSYNEFYHCEAVGAVNVLSLTQHALGAANEVNFFGGSLSSATQAIADINGLQSSVRFYGTDMETWGTYCIKLGSTTTGVEVFGGRAEQTGGTYLYCDSDGQSCMFLNILMNGVTTVIAGGITTNTNPKLIFVDQNGIVSVGAGALEPTAYPSAVAPKVWAGRTIGVSSPAASTDLPGYIGQRLAGSANQKAWYLRDDGTLKWGFMTDNGVTFNDFMRVGRGSGAAVADVQFLGTTFTKERGSVTGGFFWDLWSANSATKWSLLSTETAGGTQYEWALLNAAGVNKFSVKQNGGVCPGAEVAYASRPSAPEVGDLINISDSNTATWGAAIAGGGANKVLARYNGANWTVVGI